MKAGNDGSRMNSSDWLMDISIKGGLSGIFNGFKLRSYRGGSFFSSSFRNSFSAWGMSSSATCTCIGPIPGTGSRRRKYSIPALSRTAFTVAGYG